MLALGLELPSLAALHHWEDLFPTFLDLQSKHIVEIHRYHLIAAPSGPEEQTKQIKMCSEEAADPEYTNSSNRGWTVWLTTKIKDVFHLLCKLYNASNTIGGYISLASIWLVFIDSFLVQLLSNCIPIVVVLQFDVQPNCPLINVPQTLDLDIKL